MIRVSYRKFSIINKIFKSKSIVINSKHSKTIIQLPHNIQVGYYSNDTKLKSSVDNLLLKDGAEKSHEKINEDKGQKERSWKAMKLTLTFFGVSFTCIGAYLVITLGSPEKDLNGNPIRDDLSDDNIIKQYLIRSYRELDYYRRLIKEPSREKLLPDPLEYPYIQPKYTLVLELTDVLVHPDWTYNTGWRFKKRPMLDYFLETLHGSYEIVIYTAEQGMTVFPLIEAIDPRNMIAYKLVRDATHFSGGHHVKSLNNLNRDLTKVVCVDWNPKNVKFNPENLLKVKRWSGNDDDISLLDLATLLKTIADNDIEDVREVLKYYSEYDDPIAAFREKQNKLIEELEAQAAAKKEQDSIKASRWTPTIFNKRLF